MQKLIFDIGMHIGRDTEFYLRKGFRVVAVEANPELAREAEKKFQSEIQSGDLTIVNKALVDDHSDSVDFFVNDEKSDWGTLLPDWNRSMSSAYRKINIPTVRLESLIAEYGMPYYLKIDIEGADVYCLRSLLRVDDIPEYTSVELITPNNLVDKDVDCLELLCNLHTLGYRKFQISDQSRRGRGRCLSPALEGEFVDFQFDASSSGLFGRELQTPTFSVDQVAEIYLEYFYSRRRLRSLLSRLTGLRSGSPFHKKGWFDIHARKS